MNKTPLQELRTVTIAEAAEALNVSADVVRKWCLEGNVRYFQQSGRGRKGGTYHVVESDLLRHVQQLLRGQEPSSDHPERPQVTSTMNDRLTSLQQSLRELERVAESQPSSSADISDLMPPPHERVFTNSRRRTTSSSPVGRLKPKVKP